MEKEYFSSMDEYLEAGQRTIDAFWKYKASENSSFERKISDDFLNENNDKDFDDVKRNLNNQKACLDKTYQLSCKKGLCLEFENIKKIFNLSGDEIYILRALFLFYSCTVSFEAEFILNGYMKVKSILSYLCVDQFKENKFLNCLKEYSNLIFFSLVDIKSNNDAKNDMKYSYIKISPFLYSYLLGNFEIDKKDYIYLSDCIGYDELIIDDKVKDTLSFFESSYFKNRNELNKGDIIYLKGEDGIGKRTTITALAARHGAKVLVFSSDKFKFASLESSYIFFKNAVSEFLRDSLFFDYIPYIDNFELLPDEMKETLLFITKKFTCSYKKLVVFSSNLYENMNSFVFTNYHEINFEKPDIILRKKAWEYFLKKNNISKECEIVTLASMFCLSPGKIYKAVNNALHLCYNDSEKISMNDFINSCKRISYSNLDKLSEKIISHYQWDDLVLANDLKEQIKEITMHVKHRAIVNSEWEMGKKHNIGKGTHALFYGPSGTGKTMAAGIIANELGLDLYKIDLSTVVDKYIGETEKNLNKIFTEAATGNAILFFDEADALFGKRSDVKSSHDRHANIEVGYLLQRMEAYEGIVILATNLRKNMDKAFERRMHFMIEFVLPGKVERKLLWKNIFPVKVPLHNDIDFNFLADKFNISGASIKNIATHAAYYAADVDKVNKKITMEHLVRATKREYQKMGRMCRKEEFGEYYQYVE